MKKNYELLEHTADIRIRIKGADLKDLFTNAAIAMFDIIAEKKTHIIDSKLQTKDVVVKQKADNIEELFINWLNELLSLSAVKGLIFEDFKISQINKNNLIALAKGVDVRHYKVNVEIKAATYHELKIENNGSGFVAQVIFDT